MFKKVIVKNQPVSHSSRVGIRLMLIGIAMLTLSQSTGCGSIRSFTQNVGQATALAYRDVVWSKRAYNLRYANCDRGYAQHFENGFRAGYADVSRGGDGFVPALPPTEYRSFEYQSADGAKCVDSWFEGYPAGVAAARKDKTGTYNDIMISRLIDAAIKQDKSIAAAPDRIPVVASKQVSTGQVGTSQVQVVPPSNMAQHPQQYTQQAAPQIVPQATPQTTPQYKPTTVNTPPIVRPFAQQVGPSPTQSSQATPEDISVVSDSPGMTVPPAKPEFSVMAKSNEPLPMAQAPADWNSTRRVR